MMPMRRNKKLAVLLLTIIFVISCNVTANAHEEKPIGTYVTLVDENNNIIHMTATVVHEGDEYISPDNSRYKVVEVIGDTAKCVYQGKEKMPEVSFNEATQSWYFPDDVVPVGGKTKPTVAVYVTHSDESYVPSDGTESKEGNGGIYDVAEAFVEKLKSHGFNVVFSKNNHNPHDVNAYNRSRKTAASLLKENPVAIFDIHRDAVPAEQYETNVKGKEATRIKLVIGRTNPNSKTNLEYAKKIKAVMDKQKPGLSNGIFLGKGDYNQDLSPRAILIEVGTHKNDKESAIAGVEQFADVVPTVLGVSSSGNSSEPAKKPMGDSENTGAGTTILIILLVVAAAAGGFYLLNKGSAD